MQSIGLKELKIVLYSWKSSKIRPFTKSMRRRLREQSVIKRTFFNDRKSNYD